jgi:hypothetical protein
MADHNVNNNLTKSENVADKISKSRAIRDRIVKVCKLPFEVTQGLLANWAAAYSPSVLLGLDETSGTTAKDSSGNAHDGTYTGTYTLGEPGLFSEDKEGVDFADLTESSVAFSSYPTIGPDHSFTIACRIDNRADGQAYYFDSDSTDRFMIASDGGGGGTLDYYDGSWHGSGYLLGEGEPHLLSGRFDQSANEAVLYLNGLPIYADTYAGRTVSDNLHIGTAFNGTGARQNGLYSLYMHCDSALAHTDFYQQWIDVTDGQEHYFKETIIDDLGLATLGQQGDVVCHLPLWETAGDQAADVSMYGNHFDFVNGPTLGADPVVEGHRYSVEIVDNNDTISGTTSIDMATDDFTAWGALTHTDVDAETYHAIVFAIGSDQSTLISIGIQNQEWRIRTGDGSTVETGVMTSDYPANGKSQGWCLRRAGNTVTIWVDGTRLDQDVSHLSYPSSTDIVWPGPIGSLDPCRARHQPGGIVSKALLASECQTLSQPTFA